MNYFELYPGDYLKDTGRLTMLEHGAYLRLMLEYYATEQPLPEDLGELYVISAALTAGDKTAVRKVAERFFPVADDGLRHNGRADEEIAKAQKRMAIARENGGKGGRPKKTQKEPGGLPSGFSAGFENRGFSETKTEPGTNPQKTHSGEALQTPHAIQNLREGLTTHPPSAAVSAGTEIVGQFEGHPEPRSTPNPAAQLAIALNRAGFQCTSMNPELLAYARDGGTREHLLQVASLGECRGKKVNYVIAIARRELTDQAATVTPSARAGPAPRQLSKTATAFAQLEGMKRELATDRDPHGFSETALPQLGKHTGE